jgi:molybdopterin molybdotransferase
MLAVADAQAVVLHHARPLAPRTAPLTADALGLVLAEDVTSDLDMPPHDKAMMDGYAVRSADFAGGPAVLAVVEEITAGRTPTVALGPGQASRIMTGAPIPAGADAVVMVEHCRPLDGGRVEVGAPPKPGLHVQPRGRELRTGETVLSAGAVLRPQEFGMLAAVGRAEVRVYPAPEVAIVSTGDEVVEAPAAPGPGQIRNSNGPMLVSQAVRAGGVPRYLGIARDRVEDLTAKIGDGLSAAMLILSGGVSAGTLDLVPGVLQDLGVNAHFHKVRMKPGKPIFFGTRGDTLVFGLPGNPVSAFVGFELFVKPALRRLRGFAPAAPLFQPVPLAAEFRSDTDRPTYHPAKLEFGPDGERVRPVVWHGSPDLRALTRADALMLLPPGEGVHGEGWPMPVLRLAAE